MALGRLTGLAALLFSANAFLAKPVAAQTVPTQELRITPFVVPHNKPLNHTQPEKSRFYRPQQQAAQINKARQNFGSMDNNDCGLEIFYNPVTGDFTLNINGEFVDQTNPAASTGYDVDMEVKSNFGKNPGDYQPSPEIQFKKLNFLNGQFADVEILFRGDHLTNQNGKGVVVWPLDGKPNTDLLFKANQVHVRMIDVTTGEIITDPGTYAPSLVSRTINGSTVIINNSKWIDEQNKTVVPLPKVVSQPNR